LVRGFGGETGTCRSLAQPAIVHDPNGREPLREVGREGETRQGETSGGTYWFLHLLSNGVSTGKRRALRGERSQRWTGSVARNWHTSGLSLLATHLAALFQGVRGSGAKEQGCWQPLNMVADRCC